MLWLSPLLAAVLTLLSGSLLFALLGHDPLETLHTLLIDPIGDWYGVSELLVKALPILLCALGLAVAYQARWRTTGTMSGFYFQGEAATPRFRGGEAELPGIVEDPAGDLLGR